MEQLAVRFKTKEMTESFKKKFEECQQNLLKLHREVSMAAELSKETNPVVFFDVCVDDEHLNYFQMLFSELLRTSEHCALERRALVLRTLFFTE